MIRASQVCCCLLVIAGLGHAALCEDAPAGQPRDDEVQANAVRLIQLLGADKFSVRENATTALIDIGLAAEPVLHEGCTNPDREIRYRCERILSVIYELDFQRRLEAFAASRDPEQDYDLPGWRRYRDRVGNDGDARSLFVLMQTVEAPAMKTIEDSGEDLAELLETRSQQLVQSKRLLQQRQLPLGSIAAMLFLAGDEDTTLSQQASQALYSLCYDPTFQSAMMEGEHQPLMRKLLGDWIRRSEDFTAYQGLALAMRYDVKDGLVTAERIVKNPGQAHVRQYAILAIAKLGSKEHIPQLEPLLKDQTRTSSRRVSKTTYETQIRDVALATIIHLSKQNPKNFGFKDVRPHTQIVFNTSYLGFADDKTRAAALKKWQEFQAKNSATEPKPSPEATDDAPK